MSRMHRVVYVALVFLQLAGVSHSANSSASCDVGGTVWSIPGYTIGAVKGVAVVVDQTALVAVDIPSGAILWRRPSNFSPQRGICVFRSGFILVGSLVSDQAVAKFGYIDVTTGAYLWRRSLRRTRPGLPFDCAQMQSLDGFFQLYTGFNTYLSRNGKILWQDIPLVRQGFAAEPSLFERLVLYRNPSTGLVLGVNPNNGVSLWNDTTPSTFYQKERGLLFRSGSNLARVNKRTGRLRWTAPTRLLTLLGAERRQPIFTEGRNFLRFCSLHVTDGTLSWCKAFGRDNPLFARVSGSGDISRFQSGSVQRGRDIPGRLQRFDEKNGRSLYSLTLPGSATTGSLHDAQIRERFETYLTYDRTVAQVSSVGSILWTTRLPRPAWADADDPCETGPFLYRGGDKRQALFVFEECRLGATGIVSVDRETGTLLWIVHDQPARAVWIDTFVTPSATVPVSNGVAAFSVVRVPQGFVPKNRQGTVFGIKTKC